MRISLNRPRAAAFGKKEAMGAKGKNRSAKAGVKRQKELQVIRPDAAGIDVGATQIWVCAPAREEGTTEVQVFGTNTPELLRAIEWLRERGVKSVAMESTGVYWIPLFELLEAFQFEAVLCNARQLSRVPGRKTDVIDCQWIQQLHSYGLLKGSFRPPAAIVELRSVGRMQATLVSQRADCLRRMQKCLDQMNVRIHRAVSKLDGVTGLRILREIVKGERDPKKLAQLRDPGCRNSEEVIAAELTGHWRQDHLFCLERELHMFDFIEAEIAIYENEILRRMNALRCQKAEEQAVPAVRKREKAKSIQRRNQEPMRRALFGMSGIDGTAIDGVGVETMQVVLSEYGPRLEKFENEGAFVSHLQLAPRQNITGGKPLKKRRSGTSSTRVGQVLRMAATTLEHTQTELGAYFRHIARKKSRAVAVFATARKMATLIYRALRWGQDYVDRGAEAFEERFRQIKMRKLTQNANDMGFDLVPKESASCPA